MNPLFKDGQTVVFQGDSITDCHRDRDDVSSLGEGYANKVSELYKVLFPIHNVTFINRGISGDTTRMMLKRYDKDFDRVTPDFISILIGINDVWRIYDNNCGGTTYQEFVEAYETYLQKLKKDFPNAKIMLIEPFLLETDPQKAVFHDELDRRITAVRRLAAKYADYFLPMDGIYAKYAANVIECNEITGDSVHPGPYGHAMLAYEYLKELNII